MWPESQLSAAIAITGLKGVTGNPATPAETEKIRKHLNFVSVSFFKPYLILHTKKLHPTEPDIFSHLFRNIMAYDVYGNWAKTTGPLAPISSKCAMPDNPQSVESALEAFTAQGFTPNQLVLGIPAYGIGFGLASPTAYISTTQGLSSRYFQQLAPVAPVSVDFRKCDVRR